MSQAKKFDCVEMKNEIQRKLREQQKGMTDEEIRRQFLHEMETSDSPVAQWWRTVRDRQVAGTT